MKFVGVVCLSLLGVDSYTRRRMANRSDGEEKCEKNKKHHQMSTPLGKYAFFLHHKNNTTNFTTSSGGHPNDSNQSHHPMDTATRDNGEKTTV